MPPIRVLHTGFTGMMPSDPYAQGPAVDPYAMDQSAFYAPHADFRQDPNTQFGTMNGYRQPQGYTEGPRINDWQQTPVQNGWNGGPQGNYAAAPEMPPAGVLRILTLTSLQGCYDAIDGMRDRQTLLVMMDTIANDAEILRCQDMLRGAAFTLDCSVRNLQAGRLMLIAPAGITVLPEEQSYRMPEYGPSAYRSDLA